MLCRSLVPFASIAAVMPMVDNCTTAHQGLLVVSKLTVNRAFQLLAPVWLMLADLKVGCIYSVRACT